MALLSVTDGGGDAGGLGCTHPEAERREPFIGGGFAHGFGVAFDLKGCGADVFVGLTLSVPFGVAFVGSNNDVSGVALDGSNDIVFGACAFGVAFAPAAYFGVAFSTIEDAPFAEAACSAPGGCGLLGIFFGRGGGNAELLLRLRLRLRLGAALWLLPPPAASSTSCHTGACSASSQGFAISSAISASSSLSAVGSAADTPSKGSAPDTSASLSSKCDATPPSSEPSTSGKSSKSLESASCSCGARSNREQREPGGASWIHEGCFMSTLAPMLP
mmetsp:Transcript_172505/g.552976  ORF Transcript_172505/g.552976 Transcript_172505/m.552976 type:complete len:274 (-) Transcript_172505:60-881(-)